MLTFIVAEEDDDMVDDSADEDSVLLDLTVAEEPIPSELPASLSHPESSNIKHSARKIKLFFIPTTPLLILHNYTTVQHEFQIYLYCFACLCN
jgi:hypothetical protein